MSTNAVRLEALDPRVSVRVDGSNYQSILRSPKFQELVRSRSSFGWMLTVIMLVIYYGFILLVAFDKPLLAQKIGSGETTSVGILVGLGVIVTAFLLTLIYVVWANGRYDELMRDVQAEFGR